ncbi:MAG: rRNA pseudouridine synthase [Deltaproteobacteria bacterium]|nr:MAG: rRNA pseudouridine synthase [Deltaproteobacteria bacterium]
MERLAKIISRAGIASRREAEKLIREGRVEVNGKVITGSGEKADPDRDRIRVDGRPISGSEPRVYILLNKPRGSITTLRDPKGRAVVSDFLRGLKGRVYPVGRLDWDCSGLILLTNDGELTEKLTHPRYQIAKTYWVKVRGIPTIREIKRLEKGVKLEDGITAPAKVKLTEKREGKSCLEITVTEGRNRLVKRMCQAVGHPVLRLKRVGFAFLRLGDLKPREYRHLNREEIKRLKAL